MKYSDIPQDKRTHFWAGFIISIFIGLIFASDGSEFNHVERGAIVGFLSGFGAGLLKDVVWDLILKRGQFDKWDISATGLGAGIASFLIALIELVN